MNVSHNSSEARFEFTVDGHLAYCAYEREEPNRIVFTHTIVPDEIGGRGIAGKIVETGLQYARDEGLRVVPQCAYVAKYMERHPEWQELKA